MLRSALLIGAGIVAALVAACAPPPSPATAAMTVGETAPMPQPGGRVALNCNLADKVFVLNSAYQPPGGPLPFSHAAYGSSYWPALDAAFSLASTDFYNQLCSLDAIYINPTNCSANPTNCFTSSWGWRQRHRTLGNGRLIAISAGLWSQKPNYAKFETDLLQSILPLYGAYYLKANTDANTFEMSVLAALAHEVGHVRFYDFFDPDRTGHPVYTKLCNGTFFDSWDPLFGGVQKPPSWRVLLTKAVRHNLQLNPHQPGAGPQIAVIDNELRDSTKAGDDLDGLYQPSAPWASFFAAIAPDEDFVETYKLKVLTTATPPLTSLEITMPGTAGDHREDIPLYYRKAINGTDPSKMPLVKKALCIPPTL